MWDSLYQRMCLDQGYQILRPAPALIDAALDRDESSLGLRLPRSYRSYIHMFGPGEIGWSVRIYGPAVNGGHTLGEIPAETTIWRDPEGFWAEAGDPALVARFVCLAGSIGGDAFFWDPQDVRDRSASEYAVYVLDHSSNGTVEEVADSFRAFVERVCLGNRFIGDDNDFPDKRPPLRFMPSWKTERLL